MTGLYEARLSPVVGLNAAEVYFSFLETSTNQRNLNLSQDAAALYL